MLHVFCFSPLTLFLSYDPNYPHHICLCCVDLSPPIPVIWPPNLHVSSFFFLPGQQTHTKKRSIFTRTGRNNIRTHLGEMGKQEYDEKQRHKKTRWTDGRRWYEGEPQRQRPRHQGAVYSSIVSRFEVSHHPSKTKRTKK